MGKYYKKLYYKKKGKWSANIYTLDYQDLNAQIGVFYISSILAQNPIQNQNTVSQQYTVKNVELNVEILSPNPQDLVGLVLYIMYAPQGITVTSDYAKQHPEYIMAYRYIGKPQLSTVDNPGRNAIKVKSRLSRRLQTGDSIILFITGRNGRTSTSSIILGGVFRWWTKAN